MARNDTGNGWPWQLRAEEVFGEEHISVIIDIAPRNTREHDLLSSANLKPFLVDKNYADFGEKANYEESLNQLLKGL